MKFLRASDLEWQEFKYALAAGVPPADAFMVRGASKEISPQVQAMLEECFQAALPHQNLPVSVLFPFCSF